MEWAILGVIIFLLIHGTWVEKYFFKLLPGAFVVAAILFGIFIFFGGLNYVFKFPGPAGRKKKNQT
jgi:hypothetical protein